MLILLIIAILVLILFLYFPSVRRIRYTGSSTGYKRSRAGPSVMVMRWFINDHRSTAPVRTVYGERTKL